MLYIYHIGIFENYLVNGSSVSTCAALAGLAEKHQEKGHPVEMFSAGIVCTDAGW